MNSPKQFDPKPANDTTDGCDQTTPPRSRAGARPYPTQW
jgi:hypothetical protein